MTPPGSALGEHRFFAVYGCVDGGVQWFRNHLSAAIGKTGSRTRAEAAHLAETNGWLYPGPVRGTGPGIPGRAPVTGWTARAT